MEINPIYKGSRCQSETPATLSKEAYYISPCTVGTTCKVFIINRQCYMFQARVYQTLQSTRGLVINAIFIRV